MLIFEAAMMVPVTRAIRHLRPLALTAVFVICIFRRLSAPTGTSLLEDILTNWTELDERMSRTIEFMSYGDGHCRFLLSWIAMVISAVAKDIVALTGMLGLLRAGYCLLNFGAAEWRDIFSRPFLDWLVHSEGVPYVGAKLRELSDGIAREADAMLGKDPKRTIRSSLPKEGVTGERVLKELQGCAGRENAIVEEGKVSGTLYSGGARHSELMSGVHALYQWSNPLKPGVWPRINQCEAEIVSMTADMLHGPPVGCVTSGGTESILMAVRAHLVCFGRRRGVKFPEVICGSTAHCSLNKACQMMGVRLVTVDCDDSNSYELRAEDVRRRVTCNTIMVFASAPSFPRGTIDRIADLSALTVRYDIGLHVDACLGGFVLPFICEEDIGIEAFDFRLPGVASISADTHKYGHSTKGTSVVLFRSLSLRRASYFPYSGWSGGLYITPTAAGSRPGAAIGCAWAALVSIGEAGYRRKAKVIVDGARKIAIEIQSIPELKPTTKNPTVVVSFSSDEFDIYNLKDALSKMGWSLNPLQSPPGLNICVTENIAVGEFLRDLREAVARVKAQSLTKPKKGGTAALYDAVRTLPSGLVEYAMCRFTDASLSP
ncbi:hypothetical protein ACHAXT_005197 [Thalassiosira profunda]